MRFLSHLIISLFLFVNIAEAEGSKKPYKLTILTYMNGFHREDAAVTESMNKMESVGSSKDVAIVAEWGSLKTGKTRRLLIKKDDDKENVTSPVLTESTDDMGQIATLESFLKWGTEQYPSERVILVLGGLGSGWSGFSSDSRTKSKISLPQLSKALTQLRQVRGKKIDLVVFDVCLMSMVEVASEISEGASFMAAGMNLLTEDTWVPYDLVFAEIMATGAKKPELIGSIIARIYNDITKEKIHNGGILGIQYGVLDLSRMAEIEKSGKEFVSALMLLSSTDRKDLLTKAKASSLKYFISYYADLSEMIAHFPNEERFTKVNLAGKNYNAAVSKVVIFQAKSTYFPKASGLTISLVPNTDYPVVDWEQKYSLLRWSQLTGWDRLLIQLFKD